jgi:Metallo-beta-lactamase superfamily
MYSAEEIQQVREGLWFWQRFQPSVKVECSSCAVRVGTGLIVVDPIPLAVEATEELCAHGEIAGIVATNGNHERAVAELRERFRVPVFAHTATGIAPDRTVREGDRIFDQLEVVEIPGAGPGEIALYDPRGWTIVGDALTNLDPTGLALLPAKYCADENEMRISLRKLLRFPIEILTFAHGLPLVTHTRPRLESLLA